MSFQSLLWTFTRQVYKHGRADNSTISEPCVVFVKTQQIPIRDSVFSDCGKSLTVATFHKWFRESDNCFPQLLYRNCSRTLLNLWNKVAALQTKCATTKVNLSKGKEGVRWWARRPLASRVNLYQTFRAKTSRLYQIRRSTKPSFGKLLQACALTSPVTFLTGDHVDKSDLTRSRLRLRPKEIWVRD